MIMLSNLRNNKFKKKVQRVGRGPGSKRGKTCKRGHKGDKSRAGYKRREGKEGGPVPLFKKLPTRGFSNARFSKKPYSINLSRINEAYEDGETVNRKTIKEKGFSSKLLKNGIKILSNGELTKKVYIEADFFSKGAVLKLEKNNIEFKPLKSFK